MSLLNSLNTGTVHTIDAPDYPNMQGVKERNFIFSIIRQIRAKGYNSTKTEDQKIRKGIAKLYWLIYSSGQFSFNLDKMLTPADVVSRGWVSEEAGGVRLATILLSGLHRYDLLTVSKDDQDNLYYRLNFRFVTKDNSKTLAKRKAYQARIEKERREAVFPHLTKEVVEKIESTPVRNNSKCRGEVALRYHAKHMLSTVIEYGVLSHTDYKEWSRHNLAEALRKLVGTDSNRGIFNHGNIRPVLQHLVAAGLVSETQKHSKAAFRYKLLFTPPVVRTMPKLEPDPELPKAEEAEKQAPPEPQEQAKTPRVEVVVDPTTDINEVLTALDTFRVSINQQILGLKAQILAHYTQDAS